MPRKSPPGVERLILLITGLQHVLLYDGTGDDVTDLQLLKDVRSSVEAIEPAYEVALIELEKATERD